MYMEHEECPKSLSNPQKRIPHPQNRGGVPYTPTRPLLLPYTLVGTLPRICHIYIYIYIYIYMYYYTPLPLNLANKQQASNKHFSFLFWPLLRLIAPGSTLL